MTREAGELGELRNESQEKGTFREGKNGPVESDVSKSARNTGEVVS